MVDGAVATRLGELPCAFNSDRDCIVRKVLVDFRARKNNMIEEADITSSDCSTTR